MRRSSFRLLTAVGVIAAGAMAAPVTAAPPTPSSGPSAASEHRRIVDYWTPERRASAVPRDVAPSPARRPSGGGGGGTTSTVTGATYTGSADVKLTTGKVFFTLHGTRYVCSGSAVQSAARSLVLSAGHCVHDGDNGAFASDWIFYPAYSNGPHPQLGAWTATDLFTTTNWATKPDFFNDDEGLAVVTNGSGGTLEAALAQAKTGVKIPTVAYDGFSNATYSAFGYPAAQKYKGQTLTWCSGPVSDTVDSYESISMACDMTGGSSGGPWFRGSLDTPVINSLNSYGYSSLARMFGPIFGAEEKAAYDAASGGDCSTSSPAPCVDYNDAA